MPILCEFNTLSVHPATDPRLDTRVTLKFPSPLVTRPRLAHGFCTLDVDKTAAIRAKSIIPYSTHTWADCHIVTWADTKLHCGITNILVLKPADLDFLTGEHMRGSSYDPSSVRVNFERRFATPPKVVVFFNHIDLDNNRNWRLNVSATDIDVNGFTLHIDTWGDTILYSVGACWIAYPEDREHIFSTCVNTMDMRPVTQPQHEQSKEVAFGAVEFWKTPTVFVALNFLDVDCARNLRIKAYVDGVTKTSLVCHIDSWYDTVLYAAGVSILAFN